MIKTILLILLFAVGTPLLAEDTKPRVLFKCEGFNRRLNGTIDHYIEIYESYAVVDGIRKFLQETQAYYGLSDSALMDKEHPTHGVFSTNRITGEYNVFDASKDTTQVNDWSRPTDAGCNSVSLKF